MSNYELRSHYVKVCQIALSNGTAKRNVDVTSTRAGCQNRAKWHAILNPSSVGPDQRNPNGKC